MLTGLTPPGKYGPDGEAITHVVDLVRGTHAEERLGGEHERTHVQRVLAAGGHPVDVALDEGRHGAEEVVHGQLGQVQALGGVLETLGVRVRAEQPGGAVGVAVCLQTFEDLLGVVQHGSPGSSFSGAYGSMRRSPQPSPLVQLMWAMLSEKT